MIKGWKLRDLTRLSAYGLANLRMMGFKFRDAQQEGLEIVRELRDVVNKVLESGLHNGLQRGREEMRLRPLTAYDAQFQSCECKKGLRQRAAAR